MREREPEAGAGPHRRRERRAQRSTPTASSSSRASSPRSARTSRASTCSPTRRRGRARRQLAYDPRRGGGQGRHTRCAPARATGPWRAAMSVRLGSRGSRSPPSRSRRRARPGRAPAQQPPVFEVGVDVVAVDVSVVDARGAPVLGLAPEDFTVEVDGRGGGGVGGVRGPRRSQAPPPPPPRPRLQHERGCGRGASGAPGRRPGEHRPRRGRGAIQDAADRFLAKLTPADRVGLAVIPGGRGVDFTEKHDEVRQALQQVAGLADRSASRVPVAGGQGVHRAHRYLPLGAVRRGGVQGRSFGERGVVPAGTRERGQRRSTGATRSAHARGSRACGPSSKACAGSRVRRPWCSSPRAWAARCGRSSGSRPDGGGGAGHAVRAAARHPGHGHRPRSGRRRPPRRTATSRPARSTTSPRSRAARCCG